MSPTSIPVPLVSYREVAHENERRDIEDMGEWRTTHLDQVGETPGGDCRWFDVIDVIGLGLEAIGVLLRIK
jgi:hypothetical protein